MILSNTGHFCQKESAHHQWKYGKENKTERSILTGWLYHCSRKRYSVLQIHPLEEEASPLGNRVWSTWVLDSKWPLAKSWLYHLSAVWLYSHLNSSIFISSSANSFIIYKCKSYNLQNGWHVVRAQYYWLLLLLTTIGLWHSYWNHLALLPLFSCLPSNFLLIILLL